MTNKLTFGLLDGDVKRLKLFKTHGQPGVSQKDNDLVLGCRILDMRHPEQSREELFNAMEIVSPDRLIVDCAGGSESNLGRQVTPVGGQPEDFYFATQDLGYRTLKATPLPPKEEGDIYLGALASLKESVDEDASCDEIERVVFLNRYRGDMNKSIEEDAHPDFEYWLKSKTREALQKTGRLTEIRIPAADGDALAQVSKFSVPYSTFISPEFVAEKKIRYLAKAAVSKHRKTFLKEVQKSRVMSRFLGVPHITIDEDGNEKEEIIVSDSKEILLVMNTVGGIGKSESSKLISDLARNPAV